MFVINSHNIIIAVLLCPLGTTGAPFSPKPTTKMEYVSPSISPISVSSVMLVFPPLNLELSPAVV